jgi:hypothetical protein
MFFTFPEDARWNDDRDAVEFSVILGPYEGTVRIGRRVFQGCSISHRRRKDVWKRSISSGRGSSLLSSGSCAADS